MKYILILVAAMLAGCGQPESHLVTFDGNSTVALPPGQFVESDGTVIDEQGVPSRIKVVIFYSGEQCTSCHGENKEPIIIHGVRIQGGTE